MWTWSDLRVCFCFLHKSKMMDSTTFYFWTIKPSGVPIDDDVKHLYTDTAYGHVDYRKYAHHSEAIKPADVNHLFDDVLLPWKPIPGEHEGDKERWEAYREERRQVWLSKTYYRTSITLEGKYAQKMNHVRDMYYHPDDVDSTSGKRLKHENDHEYVFHVDVFKYVHPDLEDKLEEINWLGVNVFIPMLMLSESAWDKIVSWQTIMYTPDRSWDEMFPRGAFDPDMLDQLQEMYERLTPNQLGGVLMIARPMACEVVIALAYAMLLNKIREFKDQDEAFYSIRMDNVRLADAARKFAENKGAMVLRRFIPNTGIAAPPPDVGFHRDLTLTYQDRGRNPWNISSSHYAYHTLQDAYDHTEAAYKTDDGKLRVTKLYVSSMLCDEDLNTNLLDFSNLRSVTYDHDPAYLPDQHDIEAYRQGWKQLLGNAKVTVVAFNKTIDFSLLECFPSLEILHIEDARKSIPTGDGHTWNRNTYMSVLQKIFKSTKWPLLGQIVFERGVILNRTKTNHDLAAWFKWRVFWLGAYVTKGSFFPSNDDAITIEQMITNPFVDEEEE